MDTKYLKCSNTFFADCRWSWWSYTLLAGLEERKKFFFSKRQFGGGTLMTWGYFLFNGVGSLAFTSAKMNTEDYKNFLKSICCQMQLIWLVKKWVFHLNNTPIHQSRLMKMWFKSKNIQVFDWTSRSSDLNPIENLGVILLDACTAMESSILRPSDYDLQLRMNATKLTHYCVKALLHQWKWEYSI